HDSSKGISVDVVIFRFPINLVCNFTLEIKNEICVSNPRNIGLRSVFAADAVLQFS
ncbi:unnamed protein product, partial [Prunus brigantina]